MEKINFDFSRVRAILFDKDGVIVDSCLFHYENCLKIVDQFNLPNFTLEEFKDHHRGNFYEKRVERNIFEGINWNEYDKYIENLYPQLPISVEMKSTLLVLKNFGYHLSIISSGHESYIRENLKNNELNEIFINIWGKQTSGSKVEKFQKFLVQEKLFSYEVLYITDTLGDILEAAEVGIQCLAILNGYHSEKVLKSGGNIQPLAIIKSPKDILNILDYK